MSFIYSPGMGSQRWSRDTIMNRLNNIATAEKSRHWIRRDLTLSHMNTVNLTMWAIVNRLGSYTFYPTESMIVRKVLRELSFIAANDPEMAELFFACGE